MNYVRDFEDLKIICKVCLTKSEVLILLNNYLYDDRPIGSPLISEVLTYIMSTKIEDNYPKVICQECLEHVKQAYNLKLKFEKSQIILQKYEQSIIVSYKQNDQFEVYEEDDAFNCSLLQDPLVTNDYNFKLNEDVCETTSEFFDESLDKYQINEIQNKNFVNEKEVVENFIKMGEKYNPNEKKIFKLKHEGNNDNMDTNNIQVRCVDINKFIIEKKMDHNDSSNSKLPSAISGEYFNSAKLDYNNQLPKLKCPICNKQYSKGKLNSHIVHCRNLKITSLTCKECNKLFKKVKDLNYHIKLKHSSNPPIYPCNICGYICKNYSAKQIHMLKKHGGKKSYICEICGKAFYFNATLLRHKSKHTKEIQEVCNICGKSFHYKGALFYHIKKHTNERKYLCNHCDKKFYTSQSLRRHVDTHTGDRRFKCKFCEKSFRSSSERQRHERIHTGERPYQCIYCDGSFNSKYNHDVHVSTHRGEQPCYICDGQFLNTEVVNLHIKLKHRIKLEEKK